MRNRICTYFLIWGDFDPDDATRALGLTPDSAWCAGSLRPDGTPRKWDGWLYGLQETDDDMLETPLDRTLDDLRVKVDALNRFVDGHDVRLTLQAEITVHPGEKTPYISPTKDTMLFCCRTDADLDIELHVEP